MDIKAWMSLIFLSLNESTAEIVVFTLLMPRVYLGVLSPYVKPYVKNLGAKA